MENTHNLFMPKISLLGVGAIKDLPHELLNWKLSKALIVTDKNLIRYGWVEQVEKILKNMFIFYDIFDGVLHTNPTISFVENGLAYFPSELELRRDYHLIISIGGGTIHDCAKGIAAVATNGGSIIDYEGYNKMTKPALPHIAINTTYSGTEMTMFTIITDESRRVKMSIASPNITPLIAVNDPLFTVTLPPEITAEAGIDALGHAIEAYSASESSPLGDSLALGTVKLVFRYLRRAYENGNDLEAREQMLYASTMAGMAFNTAGLGYTHALGHQLGGFYNQLHGYYEAILLPHIFAFNADTLPKDKILRLAAAMDIRTADAVLATEKIRLSISQLRTDLGLPGGLKMLGVRTEDIDTMAQNALKDIAGMTNPRYGTLEDVKKIYLDAM